MKAPICLVLAAAAAAAALAEPVIYRLDPGHSFVHFEVLHFGTSTIRGRVGPARGRVELDLEARHGWTHVRVDTGSVDTGMPFFDARLRQSDLLDSAGQPEASYTATRFVFEGSRLAGLRGELSFRGRSQALELRTVHFGCHTHPVQQREVCGGDFEGEIDRADFGASYGMPFVANRVRLLIQVEGIRQ
jgi:polyisoprenoid-binding protein YceI